MSFEDRLDEYVAHISAGGDPAAPPQPLSDDDHEVVVHWTSDEGGDTHLKIQIDAERSRYFVNGRRTEHSWEGGVDGPEVTEWDTVREL